jgi:methionine-rich copper-binding protein CopC
MWYIRGQTMVFQKPTALLAALVAVLAFGAGLSLFVSTAFGQPEIVESDPQDGAEMESPPEVIRLCFSEPVRQDVAVAIHAPDGSTVGVASTAYPADSNCVDIQPLGTDAATRGRWTLEWNARSPYGSGSGSGSVEFNVLEEKAAPPAGGGGDSGPDILQTALITVAVMAGAAGTSLLLYMFRRAIGFDLHRPPEDGEQTPGH